MSIRVRVEPDPARPDGGHALIRIAGLSGVPEDARFALQREGWERGVLGPDGWQVGAALLSPRGVARQGEEVVLAIGPEVVDQVEAGPIRFRLPAARLDVALFWPDLPTSHAGSRGPVPLAPPRREARPAAPPPAAAPAEDQTVLLPPPRPEPLAPRAPLAASPPSRGGGAAPVLLLALLAAAAGAGGAYWWIGLREDPPADASPAAGGPVAAAPPPAAPSSPGAGAEESPPRPAPAPEPPSPPAPEPAPTPLADLTVPQVIARAPGVAEIAAEAAARAARGLHEDALLLWEAAARLGHAPSLTALGRLYDPVGFQPGRPFRTPDPRQAARYYQQAVRAGDAAAEAPRAALREWLRQQAARGDTLAPLTLQDFWP
jgi:hypothetical protein